MSTRYKVAISNSKLYKEIDLPIDVHKVTVGTELGDDVRLHRDWFFEKIRLDFVRKGDGWQLICADNLFINLGDVRKLLTKELEHGDAFYINYQDTNSEVFAVEYLIDFDNGNKRYERAVSIKGLSEIKIGSKLENNIVLASTYTKNENVVLQNDKEGYCLHIISSVYGIYHNGKKVDEGEHIHNGDFLSISDYTFFLKDGLLWTDIREEMKFHNVVFSDYVMPVYYPKFSRNTRIKSVIREDGIEVLDPPAKQEKPQYNILTQLLPSVSMLLVAGIMAYMGGSSMIIFSGISGAMAILTTLITIRENSKGYKTKVKERAEKYHAYIEKKKEEIMSYRQEEKELLEDLYISLEEEKERLLCFSSNLFDRNKEDDDFLCVRLGTGEIEAKRVIHIQKQERLEVEDELQLIPEQILNDYRVIANAPVVCDLKNINALGIVGEEQYRFEFLKNIVVDLATRQYFTDVKMVFVAREENKNKINWFRFLPYAYSESIDGRTIVCSDDSKNVVFEFIYKELSLREQNKSYDYNIVIFFYDDYGFKNHPISQFVERAKELGVTFIFFGCGREDIPIGCEYLVNVKDYQLAELMDTRDRRCVTSFSYSQIDDEQVKKIIKVLAPVYTEEISLEGSLTKNISMFELLHIMSVDDLNLEERWNNSQAFHSMAAPIGVSKAGVIELDLHDKAHGPHGLVAGTTGAGKSEILQTYILSVATLYHPYEVSFVIIDFKGGGMVNQFKNLPHLLGAITNIDGKEINRSLKSIKAELQKRQRLFAEADVNHIDKYMKKYRLGEVLVPLPHLIIIVDEFAELKAEQPEFMKELISAARIGRSLGVHLILATQKPSGQVNEQIWSNSRFKLCLKVQSKEDSNEVLKSPLAAEIKEPGRAYLQVGNNEIFELFQSAYSGAPEKMDDSKVKEFVIYSFLESGKKIPVFEQKKKKGGNASRSQLEAIVDYVNGYFGEKQFSKLPDICLPSLDVCINFPAMNRVKNGIGIVADIGIYDAPENQIQEMYTLDISIQNTIIIGSAQSGKTNILQTMIRSISSKYTPQEVNIYIIDFASRALKNFEKLNHVGGVVCPSEDEKLKNLFKLLNDEVELRKEKMISLGVSSYAAYREAGETELPQILLMIDNLTALKELYFQDDDELLNLCREGISVGVSLVIANAQTAGIGYKYLSNFSARIGMFCNDAGEYNALFEHIDERIDNIPGRCIVELDNRKLECQSFLAFEGEKEIDRVRKITQYIKEINIQSQNIIAKKIPLIPDMLTENYMCEEFGNCMQHKFEVVAGLDYSTVMPYVLDFSGLGILAVTGKENSGKHNWVKYSVSMLNRMYPQKVRVYLIDSIYKKYEQMKQNDAVLAYSMMPEDGVRYILEIENILRERYEAVMSGKENILQNADLLMLLLDNKDAVDIICNDTDALNAYKNIMGRYKGMGACIIISNLDNVAIPYSAPEMLKDLRDNHHFMYFDDLQNMKIFDIPLSFSRNFKKSLELGDGYYFKDNECVKLKTAVWINR